MGGAWARGLLRRHRSPPRTSASEFARVRDERHPLPVDFGAPVRLRLETQLGYKMVKWIRSMELIADYKDIGAGYGGWRADLLHYGRIAPI